MKVLPQVRNCWKNKIYENKQGAKQETKYELLLKAEFFIASNFSFMIRTLTQWIPRLDIILQLCDEKWHFVSRIFYTILLLLFGLFSNGLSYIWNA